MSEVALSFAPDDQAVHLSLHLRSTEVGVGNVVFDRRTHFPVAYSHLPPPPPGTKRVVDRGVVLDRRGGHYYGLPVKWEDIRPTMIAFSIRMLPWKR